MKHSNSHVIVLSAAISVLTTLIAGAVLYLFVINRPATADAIIPSTEQMVVEAVEKANPAVVAITVSKYVPVYERYLQRVPGYSRVLAISQYRQRGYEKQEVGGGSGFLVSSNGYIVTNKHVVDDESADYAVFMNDGRKYDVTAIARSNDYDLAVIKIEGDHFPYLTFSNSDELKEGQTVIAIGNALAEFRNTVSVGVVSGLARSIVASDRASGSREQIDQLIQVDVPLNVGNSGGPLLDTNGKVVGVNVAVAAGAENIGFALSSNTVVDILERLAGE